MVHTVATISSATYAAIVTPTAGKRIVLLGLEPTLSSATLNIAFGTAPSTATTSLFVGLLLGTIVGPAAIDLRECPPISAKGEVLLGSVSSSTAKVSIYTMEID